MWLKKISDGTRTEALIALYMRKEEMRALEADETANEGGYWTKRRAEVEAAIKEIEALK
jgi:hypothetical protein